MQNVQATKPTTSTDAAPMENRPVTRRNALAWASGALAAVAGLVGARRAGASPTGVPGPIADAARVYVKALDRERTLDASGDATPKAMDNATDAARAAHDLLHYLMAEHEIPACVIGGRLFVNSHTSPGPLDAPPAVVVFDSANVVGL